MSKAMRFIAVVLNARDPKATPELPKNHAFQAFHQEIFLETALFLRLDTIPDRQFPIKTPSHVRVITPGNTNQRSTRTRLESFQ
jgi:hypothetical protein